MATAKKLGPQELLDQFEQMNLLAEDKSIHLQCAAPE